MMIPCESNATHLIPLTVEQTFALLSQPRLRLQLAPDWGEAELLGVDETFPAPGSAYRLRLKDPATPEQKPGEGALWEIVVQECQAPHRLVLVSQAGPGYHAEWTVAPTDGGSMLSLHEIIHLPEAPEANETETPPTKPEDELFKLPVLSPAQTRQKLVTDWLASIARYAGLPRSRPGRLMRWLMDRYLLRMRADQRRIILALLAMQVVMFLTFVASVIGLGLAGVLLR
jgi:hypothetical protein